MTTRTSRSRRPGTGSDSLEFRGRQSFDSDPFSHILRPPPGETEEERARRIHSLQEAQRISREIDQSILESKKLYDQRKKAVKILLLGEWQLPETLVLYSCANIFKICLQVNLSLERALHSRVCRILPRSYAPHTSSMRCLDYATHPPTQISNLRLHLRNSEVNALHGGQSSN